MENPSHSLKELFVILRKNGLYKQLDKELQAFYREYKQQTII
jgi:hypothetical protein